MGYKMKTFVIDLDGVLVETEGQNYATSKPIPEAIHKVCKLVEEGHTIVIQTGRNKCYESMTMVQLDEFGIPFHGLSIGEKVAGDVYIDDKGLNVKDWLR